MVFEANGWFVGLCIWLAAVSVFEGKSVMVFEGKSLCAMAFHSYGFLLDGVNLNVLGLLGL